MLEIARPKKRIHSLDALKTLAAFMVCFQHACGTGFYSEYILLFCKIAVPVFILITGFLYKDIIIRGNIKKQIQKFLTIAIEMELFWFVVDCIYHGLKHDLMSYLSQFWQSKNIINFLIFNDPVAADHGWYMWAVLYALIICALVPIVLNNRVLKWSVIIGGNVFLLAFGKYGTVFFNHDFAYYLTRNFIGEGLPFLLMGDEIRDWYDNELLPKKKIIWITLLLSVLALVIEWRLIKNAGVIGSRDSYIMTPIVAALVFIAFVQMPNVEKNSVSVTIGLKYSLLIYIVHPLFVRVEKKLLPMNTSWQYLGVVLVFLSALIVSIVWKKCKDKWLRESKNK